LKTRPITRQVVPPQPNKQFQQLSIPLSSDPEQLELSACKLAMVQQANSLQLKRIGDLLTDFLLETPHRPVEISDKRLDPPKSTPSSTDFLI
jgi:hypothetical protein